MDLNVLTGSPLFAGVAPADLPGTLAALSPRTRWCGKNRLLLAQGDRPPGIGLLVSGTALVVMDDFWGRRAVVTALAAGDLFCEAFACAGLRELPVGVAATSEAEALFFSPGRLFEAAPAGPALRAVSRNLLRLLAAKNVSLLRANALLRRRAIRDRVIGYLSTLARDEGSVELTLPMNRQELADFLAVDRSALSAELSRMRADGLIDFRKNRFRLLKIGGPV